MFHRTRFIYTPLYRHRGNLLYNISKNGSRKSGRQWLSVNIRAHLKYVLDNTLSNKECFSGFISEILACSETHSFSDGGRSCAQFARVFIVQLLEQPKLLLQPAIFFKRASIWHTKKRPRMFFNALSRSLLFLPNPPFWIEIMVYKNETEAISSTTDSVLSQQNSFF